VPKSVGELVVANAGGQAFRDLRRALKEAAAGDLKREMNRAIRAAANRQVLPALRGAALALPDVSTARRRDGKSLRQLIAAACQVSVTNNGVRFICNRRKMPKGSESLPAAFEKGKFRHPVFPDPGRTRAEWTWVDQDGKPWFRKTISEHDRDFREALRDAVDDTFAKLQGR